MSDFQSIFYENLRIYDQLRFLIYWSFAAVFSRGFCSRIKEGVVFLLQSRWLHLCPSRDFRERTSQQFVLIILHLSMHITGNAPHVVNIECVALQHQPRKPLFSSSWLRSSLSCVAIFPYHSISPVEPLHFLATCNKDARRPFQSYWLHAPLQMWRGEGKISYDVELRLSAKSGERGKGSGVLCGDSLSLCFLDGV